MYYFPPPDNPKRAVMELSRDLRLAVPLALRRNWQKSFRSWMFVPIGCLTVMAVCAGLRALLSLGGTKLPETVLCLVILFLAMILLSWVLPKKSMESLVKYLSMPLEWSLRYINLFFTPSFVMLPRTATPPSGAEVGKIIAIFIIGYFIMVPSLAWFMRGINMLMNLTRKSDHIRSTGGAEEKNEALPTTNAQDATRTPSDASSQSSTKDESFPEENEKTNESTPASSAASTISHEDHANAKQPAGPPRHERMADWICHNFNILTFVFIFIFIGIPVFYGAHYTMPAFLSAETVIFLLAIRIPPKPKKVLHPVIVTTCFMILLIWLMAITVDHRSGSVTLIDELATYQTGNNYKAYFTNTVVKGLPLPGAGDIFSSLLDVSIVAFALPMYKYRRELLRFAIPLTIGVVTFTAGELLLYPLIAHAVGIGSVRALSFAPRSLSLPLAVLATENLEGDQKLNAVLAIMSGMSGALLGLPLLRWARIPEDDYMARGVSLGCNSSAIATAMLLDVDETAAALSSLSMNFLGILMIILTLIPPIANFVRQLAGF